MNYITFIFNNVTILDHSTCFFTLRPYNLNLNSISWDLSLAIEYALYQPLQTLVPAF
jgi:hypothetical protein